MLVAEKADLLEMVGRMAQILSYARRDEQNLRVITQKLGGVDSDFGRLMVQMEASFHHLTELVVREGMEIHPENQEYQGLQAAFAGHESALASFRATLNQLFGDLGNVIDYDWT